MSLDRTDRRAKWRWPGHAPQVYVLSLGYLFLPIALIFFPHQMDWYLIGMGGAMLISNPVSGLGPFQRVPVLKPLGLCVLLIWASLFFGPVDHGGIDLALLLTAVAIAGTLLVVHAVELDPAGRRILVRLTPWALSFAVCLYLGDRVSGFAMTDNTMPTGRAALVLLSGLAAAALFTDQRALGETMWWVGLFVAVLAVGATAGAVAGLVTLVGLAAFCFGCIAMLSVGFALYSASFFLTVTAILLPGLIEIPPLYDAVASLPGWVGAEWRAILISWDGLALSITDRLLIGHGISASADLELIVRGREAGGLSGAALQIWYGIGLPGVLVLGWIFVAVARSSVLHLADETALTAGFGAAAIVAAGIMVLFIHGHGYPAWVAGCFLIAGALCLPNAGASNRGT